MLKALAVVASLAVVAALEVDFNDQAWKERPITKVVNLLKDMQAQLEVEAKEDKDVFDQMGCWCQTNEEEKSNAIADANQRIPQLEATINESAAKEAKLSADLENLKKEVAEQESSLEKATGIREKEQAEFREQEKDMLTSATSLKSAVRVMSDVNTELPQESLVQLKQMLANKNLGRHEEALRQSLQHGQKAPSGVIFGILKQMKEEFETNLKTAQEDEAKSKSDFAALKSTKETELAAGNKLIDTKTVEKAEAKTANAQAKEDHEDTSAQLAVDTEFLANLQKKCATFTQDYQARVKVRNEEITAVGETIGILTDDEAQQSFSRSNSFIQLSSRVRREGARGRSARMLLHAGRKLSSPRLSLLATSVRRDSFAEVIEHIDQLIKQLKEEQKTEIEQKDFCVSELNQNEKQTYDANVVKSDLDTKIKNLEQTAQNLNDAIDTLKAEVAASLLEMKKASENREAENKEFQVTVADQKATQTILKKALDRLKAFYAKKGALLQARQPEAKPYKKNAGASGVMAMMETIYDESKEVEADALKSENDAQAAYESFIKDSNDANNAANQDIANKNEEMAKTDAALAQARGDLQHAINDLLSLAEAGNALHQQCDFLLKNFNMRQEKRSEEIEALFQAKAIFSGAGR